MIKSFRDRRTAAIWQGQRVREFHAITAQAERRLQFLDAATNLNDLAARPGNRLEALKGNRKGQYSIRINDQWRVCFEFHDGNAENVEIVDYH
jgi:proteic killer suppression protein